jgi:uncharacterized protein YbjT (DUF2867 family)
MRVLVVGAYGLIGGYVLARLHREGRGVVGVGRDIRAAARRFPYANWLKADLRNLLAPADWADLLDGVDAVVNCAGALQESTRDNLAAVQRDAPIALAHACAAAKIRFVHVSAAGVAPGAATPFFQTKADAEAEMQTLGSDWLILRPGFVLAPIAYGGSALLRALAAFPFVTPTLFPEAVVQVVSAEDIAEAVARALEPEAPVTVMIDLAHPAPTTVSDILVGLRGWLGLAPAPTALIPRAFAGIGAGLADAIALLGWRSPIRSTALAQLKAGVTTEGASDGGPFGFAVKSLPEMLAGWPSGVQERWFARLYLLKPVILLTLIGFWLASGIIGLTAGRTAAVALIASARLAPAAAQTTVIIGSLVDIALGLAAGVRQSAGLAMKGMVAVSLAYLAGASVIAPALWLDPLGPLVKVAPGLILALVGLAVLEER